MTIIEQYKDWHTRCRRAYILPMWFFLSFFFSRRLISLNWSQPNLDTYSLMTDVWKILGPNSLGYLPPTCWRQKTDFEIWPNISRQWNITLPIGKKLINLQGLSYMYPNLVNFGPETAENGWRIFAHPLNFCIGDTVSLTAWRLYNREQVNFKTTAYA